MVKCLVHVDPWWSCLRFDIEDKSRVSKLPLNSKETETAEFLQGPVSSRMDLESQRSDLCSQQQLLLRQKLFHLQFTASDLQSHVLPHLTGCFHQPNTAITDSTVQWSTLCWFLKTKIWFVAVSFLTDVTKIQDCLYCSHKADLFGSKHKFCFC